MVGQWTVTKPSRSDEVLDAGQQLQIADQVRALFDSSAPKRPQKPNRSEPDVSSPNPLHSTVNQDIPELEKLRYLQSQSQFTLSLDQGATDVPDEFVETQYYKELGSVEKQHHTTGTGFIRVTREEKDDIQLREGEVPATRMVPCGYRSNPAMNDWVPRIDEDEILLSSFLSYHHRTFRR